MSEAPIEVRYHRAKSALLMFSSLILAVVDLWLIGAFGSRPVGFIGLLAVVPVTLVTIIGLLWSWKMLDTKVQLRIDENGIFYRPWSNVTIPWGEIGDARIWPHGRRQTIVLSLLRPGGYPSANRYAQSIRRLMGEDVVVALTGMTATAEEVLVAIKGQLR